MTQTSFSMDDTVKAYRCLTGVRDELGLRVGWIHEKDDKHNHVRWITTAIAQDGEKWVSAHENFYQAARGLVKLLGLELQEG